MARATNVQTASPCSYNPFDGPNENPEAELPLTAGKYLYVYGDMDEDGFYEGLWMRCRWWALTLVRAEDQLARALGDVPGSHVFWLLAPCSVSPCPQRCLCDDCSDSGAGFLRVNDSRWLALGSLGRGYWAAVCWH